MSSFEDAPREISRQANQTNRGNTMITKTHPAIIIAAGAFTVLCAVGVGVLTGIIPSAGALNSKSTVESNSSLPPVLAAAGAAQTPLGSMVDDTSSQTTNSLKPIDKPTVGQPLARAESRTVPTTPTKKPATETNTTKAPVPTYSPNSQVYSSNPSSTNDRPNVIASNTKPESSPLICANCGTIESINTNVEQGQGSGAGAVIGGVLGGVLGNQVGGGRGRDVATVAGAVGGAVLGNTIEKSNKSTKSYSIRVQLEDGTFQTIKSDTDQGMRVGERVRIENQRLIRN